MGRMIFRNRAAAIMYEFAKQFLNSDRKVLVPSNTCESVLLIYQKLDIPIELVDADMESLSMSLSIVEKKLEANPNEYQAIHYVYNYGIEKSACKSKLIYLRKKYALIIIEDKALCMPDVSFQEQREPETDIELYSTRYCKCVDVGYGGFAYVRSVYAESWEYCPLAYNKDALMLLDRNFKSDSGMAWRELAKTDWLENEQIRDESRYINDVQKQYRIIAERKLQLNKIYQEIIPSELCMPEGYHNWRFQIFVSNSDEIIKEIFAEGLFASQHYKAWGDGIFSEEKFVASNRIAGGIVQLFNDGYYDEEKAERTAELVKKYGKKYEKMCDHD